MWNSKAMCTPARFSDGQYKNWLKCSLSLIIMKEALHDYINNSVKDLHDDIKQKVASSPCGSCLSADIDTYWTSWQNQKILIWYIACSQCGEWLSLILAIHGEPNNPNINWKNADIRKWATESYQLAKIFMPKGQNKTKNMPEDLDTPAVLSLMKYCNWFRKDLPNTKMLSDLICIRNKVLHSGDLRVTDGNKDQWIDKMIQLLTDMKTHVRRDVQAELEKLKREDVVINFQETEIRVLQNLVSCLDSDLATVKEDMVSMQSQLSEEMKHLWDNTTEATRNMDTLKTDVEQMRKSLDELRTIAEKMVTFFDKNPGILDIKVTETIQNIHTDVQGLQRNLSNVDTELFDIKARLTEQEEATAQLRQNVKGLKKRLEQNANDEQLSLQKEVEYLRDELLSRYKSLRTIPISPFDENEEVFTPDNFYTDIVIKYEDKERKRQEQDQSPVSYKHLFEGRQRIILTGVAGSGKSTYCRKLVNRWYNLQENKKIAAGKDGAGPSTYDSLGSDDSSHVLELSTSTNETSLEAEPLNDRIKTSDSSYVAGPSTHDSSHVADPLTNDSSDVLEQSTNVSFDVADTWTDTDLELSSMTDSACTIADEDLLKFDLLFYIYSPVLSDATKLVELLCKQCLKRELEREKAKIQEVVSKLLIYQPEKILIIFDGLDELEHTPDFLLDLFKRSLYPRVAVLMGMRRWQISRLGLKATSDYDLLLDVQGFNPNNAFMFVKRVIDLDSSKYGQTKFIDISSNEEIILSFINIPLLLLFLAHILYMNQSLPNKRRNLYNQILDCLIKRCLMKSGNNYFEPRKIQENVDYCSKIFREKYLNSAYKVAHHFLLTREGGVSVVIPEKKLIEELGDDANMKLSALLDCGIISKEDFFSPMQEKNISVTFLHMSVQEYLASIHLVQNEEAFQSFLQSLETLNDVLRHENLIIFICGLDAGHGHEAFIRICQVCDMDDSVLNYRQGKYDADNSYFKLEGDIESLNEMYKACINEMDTHDPLKIPDIFAHNDEWYKLIMSRQSSCHLKSLNLTWSEESHCVLDLSSLTYLISLTLQSLSLSEEQSRSLCSSISSFTHLHKLELCYMNLTEGVLDLSNLHDLTCLKLYSLDISEQLSRSIFRSISACTKLEMLELYGTTLHDGVLDLHALTCLISIKLGHIIVSEENRLYCCSVNGITHLEKLEKLDLLGMKLCIRQHDVVPEPSRLMRLKYIRMVQVTMCEKCSSSLCTIICGCGHLCDLELDTVTLHDGTLDLRDLTNLTFLKLHQVPMSDGCSRFLRSSISNCLKSLDLSYTTLNDDIFDLNSLTQLSSLSLCRVDMSKECSQCLCCCINTGFFAQLNTLHLKGIELHGVLDLKTLTSLTDLELFRLTMPEECTKYLCNSINACTNLEILQLYFISLHDNVLDLKKLRNLRTLKLCHVNMSSEYRKKILNESKQHCPKLKHIRFIPHDLDTPIQLEVI